jgi:hypothetical protein
MKTKHSITEDKAKLLEERQGMEVTGYILRDDDRIAFIDHGRVRWYDHDEGMKILGHEESHGK